MVAEKTAKNHGATLFCCTLYIVNHTSPWPTVCVWAVDLRSVDYSVVQHYTNSTWWR